MELSIFSGVARSGGFDAVVADAKASAEAGFACYWMSQVVQQAEAMNIIGAAAQHVPNIRFGTSVVPTYPRHPMVMAEQAMTTSLLTGGRSHCRSEAPPRWPGAHSSGPRCAGASRLDDET